MHTKLLHNGRTKSSLFTILALLLASSFQGAVLAQTPMTGDELTIESAFRQSSLIFIGTAEIIGEPGDGPFPKSRYYRVPVKVIEALKGTLPPQFTVDIDVMRIAGTMEKPPLFDKPYIYFANIEGGDNQVLLTVKIIPADPHAIRMVKQLITSGSGYPGHL
jgi:hypothetical protein